MGQDHRLNHYSSRRFETKEECKESEYWWVRRGDRVEELLEIKDGLFMKLYKQKDLLRFLYFLLV